MKKSSCELFAKYFSSGFKVEDFYSTVIANCVFNGFLSYSAIMLNIVTIHAIRKNLSLSKTFKTLLLIDESCCFWCWCWFSDSTILHLPSPPGSTRKLCCLSHVWSFWNDGGFAFYRFVLGCSSHKCRQVFSSPFSSQISGTCDSQTQCGCDNLNMAVQCFFFPRWRCGYHQICDVM